MRTSPANALLLSAVRSDAVHSSGPDFRRLFREWLGFNVRTGALLIIFFGVVRMALVLQSNVTGSYQAVSIVFVAMAALPWILLTRHGRRRVGIVRPRRWRWVLPGIVAGGLACMVVFAVFTALWGDSTQNAFVYIGGTYSAVPADVGSADRAIYFAIFAFIGVTFSPIGEELLYRGVAQEGFAAKLGTTKAALIDAAAFALVHLAHFGVVYFAGAWAFLPGPSALWLVAMFCCSLIFHSFRLLTGSILGAIASHAGFNLAMTFAIFYWLDLY